MDPKWSFAVKQARKKCDATMQPSAALALPQLAVPEMPLTVKMCA